MIEPRNEAGPDAGTSLWSDPTGMGRSMVIGCSIGVVVSFVGVTVGILSAGGTAWQSAVGLGVFVAFWGGLGFGSMMGGVAWLSKLETTSAPATNATTTPAPTSLAEARRPFVRPESEADTERKAS